MSRFINLKSRLTKMLLSLSIFQAALFTLSIFVYFILKFKFYFPVLLFLLFILTLYYKRSKTYSPHQYFRHDKRS
jgi:hypothetical protein